MSVHAKLTAIADAIRGKTGGENALTLDQMAEEIRNLSADDDYLGKLINKQLTELVSPTATGTITSTFQQGNTNLTRIDLPLITTISSSAFLGCNKLAEVNLPNVVEIQSGAFNIAWGMPKIYFPNLERITGYGYVFGSTNAEKVYFPKVTVINGERSFENARSLKTFILGSNSVCTMDSPKNFNNTPIAQGTGYIYVPSALVDSYKAATNWSVHASQFRAIEDYPEVLEGWE